ncbi:hypothetical protein [uncultured Tenacibaculum sp.]|uniref:hypothetical protein n=1 Tax=uncultured Tenacibaculum sp. TaxID=174713 RepID=UPI00263170FD|nr:hypothetical protein [uncultured Tenacibaculum sp.]
MIFISLKKKEPFISDKNVLKAFNKIENTLSVLETLPLSDSSISQINKDLEEINKFEGELKKYRNKLIVKNHNILELVRKNHGYVHEKYYQNQWMVLGMSLFGVSFGTIFGMLLGNIALLGIGLPFGMLLGIAIGKEKDKKAKQEGKQLKITCN